ncbi:MAG: tetratricopeptide repeat protein [Candidatus Omnitrophica bacterium]|nr:tetratricopeptide repeat protein [Candidatus Omnitrophota bacterium]
MEGIAIPLQKYYKPLAALAAIAVFFSVYNKYLIDRSLQDMQLSLSQVKEAKEAKEADKISGLLDFTIIDEVSKEEISSRNVAYLTLSKGIAGEKARPVQMEDLRFFLKEMITGKEAKRNTLAWLIDGVVTNAGKVKRGIRAFLNRLLLPRAPAEAVTKAPLLDSAAQFESQGKFLEAVVLYKEFIETNPNAADINYIRLKMAQGMLKSGQYAGAKSACVKVLGRSTDNNEIDIAASLLAKINEITGIQKKIRSLQDKAAAVSAPKEQQMLYFKIGTLSQKTMNFQLSQDAFKKAIDIDPGSLIAQRAAFNLGWAYKLNAQHEESSRVFRQLLEEHPASEFVDDSKFQVADNLKQQGKFKEALEILEELSRTSSDPDLKNLSKFQTGYIQYYQTGEVGPAIKALEETGKEFSRTTLGERLTTAKTDLGRKYRLEGFNLLLKEDTEGARAQFKKAISVNPKDAKAYGEMARAYAMDRKFDTALDWSKKGIEADPGDEYPYAITARIYEQRGELSRAIEYYKESLQYTPNYPHVCYNIGVDYNLLEDYDKAIEFLEEGKKYAPDFAEIRNNLGYALWNKGDYYRAIEEYKKAIELKPDYADAMYNLALAYKAQKKTAEAKRLLRNVVGLKPDSTAAKRELNNLE